LHGQAVDTATKARAKQLLEQRKNSGVNVGLVNGKFNPLVASWRYPQMNLQQMVTLWLMGLPSANVPPVRRLSPCNVIHFDRGARRLNCMKNCMLIIEQLGRLRGVWEPPNAKHFWNGATVSRLWDTIVPDLAPHLTTITQVGNSVSTHKSRGLTHAWRTSAEKLIKAKREGVMFGV
jgi:hypothetical protein